MPRIMPEARYRSIPSSVVGGLALRKTRAELLSVGSVVHPGATDLDELAGADHRRVADPVIKSRWPLA